jgi:tryptophan 2,3-dioxygenase
MSAHSRAGSTPADDQLSYAGHLQLDTLLAAMRQITPHPEEHIFVTVHHAMEIWFKQLLFDLERVIRHLDSDEISRANWLLKRLAEIMRLAEGHWTVLEGLASPDFHEFRIHLKSASGMQSRQFREVEVLCGLCETAGPEYRMQVEKAWPDMIAAHPRTLRTAFFGAIERSGCGLLDIYRERWTRFDLFSLAEHALEFDRRFQSWRYNHILMVRRQIGIRTRGTGGTFAKDYLKATMDYLYFPELWEVRHEIASAAGAEVAKLT